MEGAEGDASTNIQLGIFLPSPLNGTKAKRLRPTSGTVGADHANGKPIAESAGKTRKRRSRADSSVKEQLAGIVKLKGPGGEELLPNLEKRRESAAGSSKKRKWTKRKPKRSRVSTLNSPKIAADKECPLDYLHKWDRDISSWTFRKKTQYWLLQNACDKSKVRYAILEYRPARVYLKILYSIQVPKVEFKILLRYMEALKGNQRQLTVARAQQIVEKHRSIESVRTVDKRVYKRALKILEVLL